ncbi:MAG: M23 family metallopeptidase [Pseudomonadota bacterium]
MGQVAGAPLALLSAFALAGCSAAEAALADNPEGAAPEANTAEFASEATPKTAPPVSEGFTYRGELTQGGYIRGLAPTGASAVVVGDVRIPVGDDRVFFAAFDRDSPAELTLSTPSQASAETLTITPRDWQISRVNVAKRAGGSNEAWWKKRKPEWEAIVAARAQETGAQGWRQDFVWPVKGRISGLFGRQRIYRGEPGSYHSGIDIAPGHGVPFVAPADGVVVLARTGFSLEGGLIIIDHGAGLNSAFLHSSAILVKEGEAVTQGQRIGRVGSTGRATGPHLHWSLKWNDARLDPLLFTGPMQR